MSAGLQYKVFAENLQEISALTFGPTGGLFATLEKRHGLGQVVHIEQGRASTYLANLDKPDGILLRDDIMYVTSESGGHALMAYELGVIRYIDGVFHAEGIGSADLQKILVIEDKKLDGRLLRIDPASGDIEVLLSGLKEGEGVCQSPGGDIYYVEKTKDRLSRYAEGHNVTVVTGLVKPAYLNCLPDGSLLITEDRVNFGRLLHYKHGVLRVLATNLRSPQSVIVGSNGDYYLAEQRKNRILIIYAS